jgi:hypothetical protein
MNTLTICGSRYSRFGLCCFLLLLLLLLLLTNPVFAQPAPSADHLKPLTACMAVGPHKIDAIDRLPQSTKHRSVLTENGERAVSTDDGYRVVLSWPTGGVFANFKIERSRPGNFADDREAIVSQMRLIATRSSPSAAPPLIEKRSGVEIVQLQRIDPAGRGASGFLTLFEPRTQAVVTAYLMNQSGPGKPFTTVEEYHLHRDSFIDAAVFCLHSFAKATAGTVPP